MRVHLCALANEEEKIGTSGGIRMGLIRTNKRCGCASESGNRLMREFCKGGQILGGGIPELKKTFRTERHCEHYFFLLITIEHAIEGIRIYLFQVESII
jgi:hypothetical protein